MSKYVTTQRRMLISFLNEHPDSRFSAKEIAERLQDSRISPSAIYRNLRILEEEGQITSIQKDGSREKYFRCMLSKECRSCIHLVCTKCGKTFHLVGRETERLTENTLNNDGFTINAGKSVLYGTCRACGINK